MQSLLVLGLTLFLGLSLIQSPYPDDQFLQHSPMPIVLPMLWIAARRGWLSTSAMTCIVLFLVLHGIGARYVYSNVPSGDVLQVFSFGGPEGRNHYDRLVHLAFGVLIVGPLVEVLVRHCGLAVRWARTLAFLFVMGVSGLYEVFEWLLAVVMSPESAHRYNGQQGDLWDAQKDMALAILGALVLLPWSGRSWNARAL